MVKNIVNAIVEQMEKENFLNIEMKEYLLFMGKWVQVKQA